MTDKQVNITNYIHRDARERAHSIITYGVSIYMFYNSEVKKNSCLATKCPHANYLVVAIEIY